MMLEIALAVILTQSPASVEGVITKASTHEPVSKAIVELRSDSDNSIQYTVATGDDGHYVFRDVRAGHYRLAATHTGYVRIEYAQRKPSGRGLPIEVKSGQGITGIQLSMIPTGAIYGRVYGPGGQPIIKANVQALKVTYENGQRAFTPVQTTLTNDLGEYRIFWLPPGQYFVGANAPDWNVLGDQVTMSSTAATTASPVNGRRFGSRGVDPLAPLRSAGPDPARSARYLPVYYPNTSDRDAAQSIDVQPGADLGGIDLLLSPLRTRRVRGIVTDGDTGQPMQSTPGFASSIQSSPSTDGSSNTVNSTTGAFDIQIGLGATMLSVAAISQTGQVRIPPGDMDLDGVQIKVRSGTKLLGRIIFEGSELSASDPRLTSLRVTLRGDPQVYTLSPDRPSGVPVIDGTFTIEQVIPGDYGINVTPILNLGAGPPLAASLQNAYVKSIRLGKSDVLNEGLHIGTDPPEGALTITVGVHPGLITGIAQTERQDPDPDAIIVLVPTQRQRTDLYRSVVTDGAGRFKIDRIPPGTYKLFAWEDVESGAWQDARFIRDYEDLGKPVVVTEGVTEDVSLAVIPAK